jgi:hypothetical protein
MKVSSRACFTIATAQLAAIGFMSGEVSSRPLIVEESMQLQSPDAQLPLNGPMAIHGNTIVAGSTFEGEAVFRCVVFLFERPSAMGPGDTSARWPISLSPTTAARVISQSTSQPTLLLCQP